MNAIQSHIANQIKTTRVTKLGDLHFLHSVVIIEFKEGLHITHNNSAALMDLISDYYGDSHTFGIISNMIHSHSVSPVDTSEMKSLYPNLTAYSAICYNELSRSMVEFENSLCNNNNAIFNNLEEGVQFIKSKVTGLQSA